MPVSRIYPIDDKIYFIDIETGAIKLLDIVKGSQSVHASRHETGGADVITGFADLTTAQTFTNKRITKRVVSIASHAAPTPDSDITDIYTITALAEATATFGAPTGTPTAGQMLLIRIKDDGTARILAWNNGVGGYRAGTDVILPLITIATKTMYILFIYNAVASKWDLAEVVGGI